MNHVTPQPKPMNSKTKISSAVYTDDPPFPSDKSTYCQVIGQLIYLSIYNLQQPGCAQFRVLKGNIGRSLTLVVGISHDRFGLQYGPNPDVERSTTRVLIISSIHLCWVRSVNSPNTKVWRTFFELLWQNVSKRTQHECTEDIIWIGNASKRSECVLVSQPVPFQCQLVTLRFPFDY